jgi:hypothetical protein
MLIANEFGSVSKHLQQGRCDCVSVCTYTPVRRLQQSQLCDAEARAGARYQHDRLPLRLISIA